LKHLEGREHTTARLVTQYVSAFSGRGGSERATEKLEQMCKNGLLVVNNLKASNGRPIRVYALPHAVSDATEHNVGSVGSVDGVKIEKGMNTPAVSGTRNGKQIENTPSVKTVGLV
jgi:hypothetical protein